jgi:Ca2+-binding RTX toxin-like protein
VNIDALSIAYNSSSGNITVSVTYPEPFWDEYCVDLGWFGSACFPYPNVRSAPYSFTVGNLKVVDPPPPPVLGQVDDNGVLTVNAGSLTNRNNRILRSDEVNESVVIDAITPLKDGTQTVTLRMFDVTQEFPNVQSISIANMNGGKDVVEVLTGVKVPGNVNLGSGDDRFINQSTASWTVVGGAGADRIRGGSASESLSGGAGMSSKAVAEPIRSLGTAAEIHC